MGTWSAGIFGDDVGREVKYAWIDAFRETHDAAAATARVQKEFKSEFADDDDGPVAWLALALIQWRYGHLDANTKAAALKVIDKEEGLERWEEAGSRQLAARKRVYAQVRATLTSPMREAFEHKGKIKTPENPGLKRGDVFSLPLPDGKPAFFKVVGLSKDQQGVHPVVCLFKARQRPAKGWAGAEIVRFPNADWDPQRGIFATLTLHTWRAAKSPRSQVQRLETVPVSAEERAFVQKRDGSFAKWEELASEASAALSDSPVPWLGYLLKELLDTPAKDAGRVVKDYFKRFPALSKDEHFLLPVAALLLNPQRNFYCGVDPRLTAVDANPKKEVQRVRDLALRCKAVAEFGIKQFPKEPGYHEHLGKALWRLGKKPEAEASFKKFKSMIKGRPADWRERDLKDIEQYKERCLLPPGHDPCYTIVGGSSKMDDLLTRALFPRMRSM